MSAHFTTALKRSLLLELLCDSRQASEAWTRRAAEAIDRGLEDELDECRLRILNADGVAGYTERTLAELAEEVLRC